MRQEDKARETTVDCRYGFDKMRVCVLWMFPALVLVAEDRALTWGT
jgi:hypothetical protein